jgi:hypothetical protein
VITVSGSTMDYLGASRNAEIATQHSPNEADALMAMMAQSIDVTRLQFKRLKKDLTDYNGLPRHDMSVRVFGDHEKDEDLTKSREIRTALFADVRFLLISLHETDKILAKLKTLFPHEADLANLRNRHRPLLKRCTDFRNHMEHFDKNNGAEDFGSLSETRFQFHGKTIDLGPEFEKCAESFFCDLMSIWTRMSDRQRKIRELISRKSLAS